MRPELQLFVHVLAATVLFGATATVAILALAARGRAEQLPFARAAFGTLLLLGVPAWVLTLAFGEWILSKANWPEDLAWIEIGRAVADGGLLVLLVCTGLAYWWTRRPDKAWVATAVAVLACLELVALGVTWWVMTAKVPT
jgi:hypothetical protein